MPRRVPDYSDAFAGWNYVSSIGSIISIVATVIFIFVIYDIFTNDKVEVHNPWATPAFFVTTWEFINRNISGTSIEWTIKSPSPYHSFSMLPVQS